MPSTNGHGLKQAILYARVSTEEQAHSGFSLAQQLQALREYAAREGYEVLEEIRDEGWSGAYLERPGLDRVRDLVETGAVAVVVAQDADRITRDPGHRAFLDDEFERLGTRLVALDDWGDGTHEGELLKFLKGWVSKGERLKLAERSRRGKLQKAREGKIIATRKPPYGFRYNEQRDGLIVHEPEMVVVEKIFWLAAEGFGTGAIQTRLYREGIPSPAGRELWHRGILKRIVLSDIYKPHTYEEAVELVPKEVGADLDPSREYGIRWWNRSSQKMRQASETGDDGQRRYRRKVAVASRAREEWIATPIPTFLPRELVERARTMIALPRAQERKNLAREWELRGLMRCGCGAAMSTHTVTRGEKLYYYYRCHRSVDYRRDSCRQRLVRAERIEGRVWDFVSGVLKDPERIRAGMDALIEQRLKGMRGNPEREAKAWLDKIAEVDQERRGYLRLAAKGHMTDEDLDRELAELEETRRTAKREMETLRSRREEVEELKRDRDALLASWAGAVPKDLGDLTSGQRNELYRRLRLEITPREEGYEVKGPFCTSEPLCSSRSLITAPIHPRRPSSSATSSPR